MRSEHCGLSAAVCLLGPSPSAYLPQGPARSIYRSTAQHRQQAANRRPHGFHACVRKIKQHTYEFCCRLCRFVLYKGQLDPIPIYCTSILIGKNYLYYEVPKTIVIIIRFYNIILFTISIIQISLSRFYSSTVVTSCHSVTRELNRLISHFCTTTVLHYDCSALYLSALFVFSAL